MQKALLLYQELIRFHLDYKNPEALIDLDLARLRFMYGHAVLEDKDSCMSRPYRIFVSVIKPNLFPPRPLT